MMLRYKFHCSFRAHSVSSLPKGCARHIYRPFFAWVQPAPRGRTRDRKGRDWQFSECMSQLHHDVLYALLGYTGKLVERRKFELSLADIPALDCSEKALIKRLLKLGNCYIQLEAFIFDHLFDSGTMDNDEFCAMTSTDAAKSYSVEGTSATTRHVDKPQSPYLCALAEGLEQALQPYRSAVLEAEQRLLQTPEPSLTSLQLGFASFELLLHALVRLVTTVRCERLDGAALIDHLFATASSSAAGVRACLSALLGAVQRVLMSQLSAWLLYGELLPADDRFFIERTAPVHPTPAQKEPGAAAPAAAAANATAAAAKPATSHPPPRVLDNQAEASGFEAWGAYQVAVHKKPELLPMRLAEQALFIGRAVRVLASSDRMAHAHARESTLRTQGNRGQQGQRGQTGSNGQTGHGVRMGDGNSEAALDDASALLGDGDGAAAAMRRAVAHFSPQLHALTSVSNELPVPQLQRVLDAMQVGDAIIDERS
eukprot:6187598-Pleurochrysis_carterae.AAC.2